MGGGGGGYFHPSPLTRPQSWDLIYSDLEELNDVYH